MKKRNVKLVGAGPGDKDLITVKGMRAIRDADVILYDALVNKELLQEAKADAELIYVGKRSGAHSSSQNEINLTLLQCALMCEKVVRLKGGDPFIFGRGHEELEYLSTFDIDVEIIPGISSSTSLPLLQKVPLTKRGISEGFWVLTGTTTDGKLSADIKLGLKSSATLVILMGMGKLHHIIKLIEREGKEETPIMIIQNGSMPNEKVLITDGRNAEKDAREKQIGTPGIIVIGEVVKLHPDLVIDKIGASWVNT